MEESLEELVQLLRSASIKASCAGELYHNGVKGPCIITIERGPLSLKGVVFYAKAENLDKAVLEAAKARIDNKAHMALIIVEGEPGERERRLLEAMGIAVIAGKPVIEEAPEEEYHIRPRIREPEKALERAKPSSRGLLTGVLAGRQRVELLGYRWAYLKVRCYNIILNASDLVPDALEALEVILCFETATGSLVEYSPEEGLVLSDILVRVGELEEEPVEVIKYLAKAGRANISEIADIVGSVERARVVIDILSEFGLVEVDPDGSVRLIVAGIDAYNSPQEELFSMAEPGAPTCGKTLEVQEVVDRLDEIVGSLGKLRKIVNLYYPVLIGVFRKYKDSRTIDVAVIIDGVTGRRMEDVEDAIAGTSAVLILDNIIEEIVSGSRDECQGLGSGSTNS